MYLVKFVNGDSREVDADTYQVNRDKDDNPSELYLYKRDNPGTFFAPMKNVLYFKSIIK